MALKLLHFLWHFTDNIQIMSLGLKMTPFVFLHSLYMEILLLNQNHMTYSLDLKCVALSCGPLLRLIK